VSRCQRHADTGWEKTWKKGRNDGESKGRGAGFRSGVGAWERCGAALEESAHSVIVIEEEKLIVETVL